MPFYSAEQTERSRRVLDEVLTAVPDAVLIGGWGTWVRIGGEMSHDIDIIVAASNLDTLSDVVGDVSTSTHVGGRKYRGERDGIHVDVYVTFQSRLGAALQLRVEHLIESTEVIDGYKVLTVEAHVATKMAALLDRPDTQPGEKDRHELIELYRRCDPDPKLVFSQIEEASHQSATEVTAHLANAMAFLSEYRPTSFGTGLTKYERRALRSYAIPELPELRVELPEPEVGPGLELGF